MTKPDAEEKKWNAFWTAIPGWVRLPVTVILSGLAGHYGMQKLAPPPAPVAANEVYWDEKDLRQIMRQELSPLDAGFKAFVATQPAKTQLAVLQAMEKARDRREK